MKLLLASQSPRRIELLRNAGFDFEVIPSGMEEDPPMAGVLRRITPGVWLAPSVARGRRFTLRKFGVGSGYHCDHRWFDSGKARRTSGCHAHVAAALGTNARGDHRLCLVRAPDQIAALDHESTFVTFREMNGEEIRDYVATTNLLTKPALMPSKGWPPDLSPIFPVVTSMWWAFRWLCSMKF